MVNRSKALTTAAGALAPKLVELAPGVTSGVIRQALHRAIVGVGPLPGAAAAAEKQLKEQKGDTGKAVREVIENHVALASAGGFATNLGGLATMTLTVPANVSGLAIIQSRMVAAIAHLRGYDLEDPRTRNAILVCLLGSERVSRQVKRKKLPAPPMAIATAPAYDPALDKVVATEVAAEMLSRVAGKRLAATVGKRIPVIGGVVGAGTDAWTTYQIGRYAARELLPRAKR
ncbi:EcsC family protein [Nocardioides cheoyonin]|uniref:EcsC family protein n=1 Tax=Nocardioides cheoyonin TaxID=3156615 RepID=UPI0032B40BEA